MRRRPRTHPTFRFDCLHPEWSDDYGSDYRWANVVKIDDWSFRNLSATVFPNDRMRAFMPRVGTGGELRLSTTEGVVIFPTFKNSFEYWEVPDGTTAISEWLTANSTASAASDAGRATEQIVQTLGGFGRVSDLAKKGIIETLDKMSRRPITHSAHHWKFRNQIETAGEGDIWRRRSFATLVDRTAVELGLEVRCEKCSSWSWFALNRLGYQLQCSLCLQSTAFPCAEPGNSEKARWAYRVVGPFALPDYARGGYAAALSLRCLAAVVGGFDQGQMTWCAGRELSLNSGPKVETDFIVWYQRKGITRDDPSSVTEIVFGEAKSFGRDSFRTEDVANLKAIAQRFPGSVLVFATMRQPDDMSTDEIRAIRRLALWGREPIERERRTRAPVVVLTGIELFSGFLLRETWRKLGGRHAALGDTVWPRTDNLTVLADITQQLYLVRMSFGQPSSTSRAFAARELVNQGHGFRVQLVVIYNPFALAYVSPVLQFTESPPEKIRILPQIGRRFAVEHEREIRPGGWVRPFVFVASPPHTRVHAQKDRGQFGSEPHPGTSLPAGISIFAGPGWTRYTPESRSAHENRFHRTIVQVLRPSLSPR